MKHDYTLLEWTDDTGERCAMRLYHDWNEPAWTLDVERFIFEDDEEVDNPLYIKDYR